MVTNNISAATQAVNGFEAASKLLANVWAWPQDGEQAYFNVHFALPKTDKATGQPVLDAKGEPAKIWLGRAFTSLTDAVGFVQWIASQPDTLGVWFCISSQKRCEPGTNRNGKPVKKALRSQANALALKAVAIDLDFRDYGNDPDKATGALYKFIADVGLPQPSVVVLSGNGAHIYWITDRALTRDEWQPLADALAAAGMKHEFVADWGCTTDCARLLRVPCTLNKKYDPPRLVTVHGDPHYDTYTKERLWRALEPYKGTVARGGSNTSATWDDGSNIIPFKKLPWLSELAAIKAAANTPAESLVSDDNIAAIKRPINLDDVAKECGFINEAITTGGKNYTNPMWGLTTLTATFTEGGREDAHRMAKGHPKYTQAETDTLFDRKVQERQDKNLGWARCKAISDAGCKSCANCPHFADATANNKSPLHYGLAAQRKAEAAAVAAQASQVASAVTTATSPAALAVAVQGRGFIPGGTYSPQEIMDHFNARYMVGVADGGEVGIYEIQGNGTLEYMEDRQFRLLHANVFVEVADGKGTKLVPASDYWAKHKDRHTRRLVFKPDGNVEPGEFNIWSGFAMAPRPTRRRMRRLLRHIWKIVCRCDKAKFKYFIKWLAFAVQHPEAAACTVIVLKSDDEGTGKGTAVDPVIRAFGRHAFVTQNSNQIVGQFTVHLERTVLLFADECSFEGAAAVNKFKSLITEPNIPVEGKFRNARMVPNHLHIIMANNNAVAAVMGKNDRRFVVFDVDPAKTWNEPYFDALYDDLNNGGREEFLDFLLKVNLTGWHPRRIIRTKEAADQMRMSADSLMQWLQACVEAGVIVGATHGGLTLELGKWQRTPTLQAAYGTFCQQNHLRTITTDAFGKRLAKLFDGRAQKMEGGMRCWGYYTPDEDTLRKRIDGYLGIK